MLRALIGLQWGDEGKGKVVDAMSERVDMVVRAQGGANAGHTIRVGDATRVLHLVPSGMLYPEIVGVVGNGVVVDPFVLLRELEGLLEAGYDLTGRLWVSDRAHVVLPYHAEMDEALEHLRGQTALGTTKRGIGPAYMDKAARTGLRMGELRDPVACAKRVMAEASAKYRLLDALGLPSRVDPAAVADRLLAAAERLLPLVADTVSLAHEAVDSGRNVLIEGAQGSLLDLDLGTYPYVTSSSCHTGGLLAGSGLPPRALERVIGVAKAYCTRVGGGPFPSEDLGSRGEEIRRRGTEFGSTTGRPRRCGWLDLVALRWAVRTNGVDEIALTKADVLSGQPEIPVCHAYDLDGVQITAFPADGLEGVRPVYRTFPGFDEDLAGIRRFEDLPGSLRDLIGLVEDVCGVPVTLVSTGPERGQTIQR
jgi:adenylosuccinate synthase